MIESSVPEVQKRALNCAILEEKVSVAVGLKALNLELTKLTGQRNISVGFTMGHIPLNLGTVAVTVSGKHSVLIPGHLWAMPGECCCSRWLRVPVCHCHSIALSAAAAPPALLLGFVHCPSLLVKNI